MDPKVRNQIKRVAMISDMINERLRDYQKDKVDYEKWQKSVPENEQWRWYPHTLRTNKSEIKRLMLVQRQEMIKLEKLI